jgi:hypothetical protein
VSLTPAMVFAAKWIPVLAVLVMVGGFLVSDDQEVPTLPSPKVGVVADVTWGVPRTEVDREVDILARSGVQWVRANVSWSAGEPDAPGVLNEDYLAQVDYAVGRLRAAGMQVLMPIADGVPYWASADPAKYTDASGRHWNRLWQPREMSDYTSFLGRMVARYSAQGVHTFEVWNEPNFEHFWPSGPSAVEYTRMLEVAYPVIKSIDPGAVLVMGGLSKNDYTFLEDMYVAGARKFFDVANVHPYTGSAEPGLCWNQAGTDRKAKDAFCGIEEIYAVMSAHGDTRKPLWLTELGWATGSSYGVSEAQQSDYLIEALHQITDKYPYVELTTIYSARDTPWIKDGPGVGETESGLMKADFTPKPAFRALVEFLRQEAS